jgi:hypothetical protein
MWISIFVWAWRKYKYANEHSIIWNEGFLSLRFAWKYIKSNSNHTFILLNAYFRSYNIYFYKILQLMIQGFRHFFDFLDFFTYFFKALVLRQ